MAFFAPYAARMGLLGLAYVYFVKEKWFSAELALPFIRFI